MHGPFVEAALCSKASWGYTTHTLNGITNQRPQILDHHAADSCVWQLIRKVMPGIAAVMSCKWQDERFCCDVERELSHCCLYIVSCIELPGSYKTPALYELAEEHRR